MLPPPGSCTALSSKHAANRVHRSISVPSARPQGAVSCGGCNSSSIIYPGSRLHHGWASAASVATQPVQGSLNGSTLQCKLLRNRKQNASRQVQVHVASGNAFSNSPDSQQPQQQQPLTVANASINNGTAVTSSSSSSSSSDSGDAAAVSTLVAAVESPTGDSAPAGSSASISAETAVLAAEGSTLSPSDSADDLCQVDEVDTPEGLTDLNYAAPSTPTQQRRYSSGYVPGKA